MQFSRTLREGTLVTRHGQKIIRHSGRRRILGVFTRGGRRVTLLETGEKITTDIPAGIVIYGPATWTMEKPR